ncbi:MAG TPA: hypothetical protein PKO06_08575, partial [Candidatus Ozemobacteraceae bacterium]|nr:hypothetical protein [Candidatus Ozemobacteraceae bacterium]
MKHLFSRGLFLSLARIVGWGWVIFWFLCVTAYPPFASSGLRFRISAPPCLTPGARQNIVLYLYTDDGIGARAGQAALALRRPDGRWLGPWTMLPSKPGVCVAEFQIPAEASEGTVEPWLSLDDRPFMPLPGAALQVRHLAQLA